MIKPTRKAAVILSLAIISSSLFFTAPKAEAFVFKDIAAFFQRIWKEVRDEVRFGVKEGTDTGRTAATIASNNTVSVGDPAQTGAVAKATTVAHQGSDAPCVGIEEAERIASTADSGIISSFTLVSGSAAEVVKLKARIVALEAVLKCRQAQKAAIAAGTPEHAVALADKTAAKLQEITAEITTLKQRIGRLKELVNDSAKDFLITLLTKVGLGLQKEATNRMLKGAMENQSMKSIVNAADAITNQINTVDYVNKNYKGETAKALIVQSISTNSLVAPQLNKIRNTYASNKAMQYAGAECMTGALLNDPNFNRTMAKCGNAEANPLFQGMVLGQESNKARAEALKATEQVMANSKGFYPSLKCEGSLAVQKQMKDNLKRATDQLDLDQKAYIKAKDQYQAIVPTRDQNKIAQAKAVLDAAKAKWEASLEALDKMPTANSNETLETMCRFVASGAHFSDTINSFVEAQLNKQLDMDLHKVNGLMTRIADTAANTIVNLAFGNGASVSSILKELGFQGIGLGTQAIMQSISEAGNSANSNASGGLGGTAPFNPTDSCPVPGTCGGPGNTGYNSSSGSVAGTSIFQVRGPAPSIR